MPNYYVKLTPPFFHHLKGLISNIIRKLDNLQEGTIAEAAVSTIYHILKIAERVVEKNTAKQKTAPLKVLIEGLGETKTLRSEKTLARISSFLMRRGLKKKENKGVMGFTKGLFSSLTGRKEDIEPTE